jgi:hypothetical protein
MKSNAIGKSISRVEVTNISAHGVWMLLREHEYFLSFDHFPQFKNAKVSDILNVRLEHDEYLFWPSLNVDLELESIKNPEWYPLRYT